MKHYVEVRKYVEVVE